MNKMKQQRFLAIVTFMALFFLMFFQVRWLFNAAEIEENNFNNLVKYALLEAQDEIGKSALDCDEMKNYLCGRPCKKNVMQQKIAEIDGIIKKKLSAYQINLDYTFNISSKDSIIVKEKNTLFGSRCYLQSLNGLLEKNGIQIQLAFPERTQFLLAQLSGAFVLAFFSIIFVTISFFITYRLYSKEQRMVKQTSDFINNMVHEFQTPLSNIRMASNLIQKKKSDIADDRIIEYLNVIQSENRKMERNVHEILKISCIGKESGEYSKIDVNQIISNTVLEFKTRLESEEGILTLQLNATHSSIYADINHIKLIISNLIDNAIKYSVGSVIIEVNTENTPSQLFIKVKDKGIGIDKKDHGKIFDKYYRVSTGDVHNVKGFGLGLTYVKKLVELYRGKIEVSSVKGQGTEFIISLPLKNEKD